MLIKRLDSKAPLEDRSFADLPEILKEGEGIDQLWVNDTRVIRARLLMQKSTGGRIEVFLLEPVDVPMEQALLRKKEVTMRCMVKGAKRWKSGPLSLNLPGEWEDVPGQWQLSAQMVGVDVGQRLVAFTWSFVPNTVKREVSQPTWGELVEALGAIPLPPYMRRSEEVGDEVEYQTVYAKHPGSVAAPTAGLHFDHDLWTTIQDAGTDVQRLTLHVGAGTFVPLGDGEIEAHEMHAERCWVSYRAIEALARPGLRRCATGTTSLRTLESLYWIAVLWHQTGKRPTHLEQWAAYEELSAHAEKLGWSHPDAMAWLAAQLCAMDPDTGHSPNLDEVVLVFSTSLMMIPGYRVRSVDALITNFHLPGSTLLCLVEAFVGPAWRDMYTHALENNYRFLSYGDGCYIERPS